MTYCYGDTTPFPLHENFIDTLGAAVDACVALFREEQAEQLREDKRRLARKEADEELQQLDRLEQSVEQTMQDFIPPGDPSSESDRAAQAISRSATATVGTARFAVTARRDEVLESLKTDLPGAIRDAVSDFFTRFNLPDTFWRVHWSGPLGSDEPLVQLHGRAAMLEVFFAAIVPPDSRWAEPLKVSSFAESLVVPLSRETGLRKKPKVRDEPLHRLYITDIRAEVGRLQATLGSSARKRSAGYRIAVDEEEVLSPTVTLLDEEGQPQGEPQAISGAPADALEEFAERVQEALPELVEMRSSIRGIRLGKDSNTDMDQPARLAEIMLAKIAPIVREMRLRSSVPGELVLKRDLGNGRREELFVPREQLLAKLVDLRDEDRLAFEAMGLSDESTREFVVRVSEGDDKS